MAVNQSGDKFVTLEKLPDRSHFQRRRGDEQRENYPLQPHSIKPGSTLVGFGTEWLIKF